jgi:hypothetical protein
MIEKTPLRYQGALSQVRVTKSKPAWIELEWIDERSDNKSSWIAVTLNLNGETATALSPAIPIKKARHGVHRAAMATLKGIELLVHHQLSCELLDLEVVRALGATLVMVRVRIVLDGETVEVFGSARAEDDFLAAAANAALDATNLYIDYILSPHE